MPPISPDLAETVTPWQPDIPPRELAMLRERLLDTRWPQPRPVSDGSGDGSGSDDGPPVDQLRRLVARWAGGYDWDACAAELHRLGASVTTIDGVDIWFLHVRSPHPDALPLLLCHGWPGSVLEFRHMVDDLVDPTRQGMDPGQAFELVIPAMPGFGFSGAPEVSGWGPQRIARAWVELMRRLGHRQWGMHGGDWGSAVVEAISRLHPPGCIGMHVNLPLVFPDDREAADADDEERRMIADAAAYQQHGSGYAAVMASRPAAVGYGLDDSPVGLAAWIYDLFLRVGDHDGDPTDVVALDDILDDVMLYWLPRAATSSARLYREAGREQPRFPSRQDPNPMPAGFSIFPREAVRASRRWVEARYPRTVFYRQAERGGHFAALEQPAQLTADIRATFDALRRQPPTETRGHQ